MVKLWIKWLTGNEEIDAEATASHYTFDTVKEAQAFKDGIEEAMRMADGWLNADVEIHWS